MSQKKKDKWVELGVLIRNTKTKDGKSIPEKEQKTYLKLSDEVFNILKEAGLNVAQNGILTSPVAEVESLYKLGFIAEDKIEERRQSAKDANNTWLKYKIQLPPPKESQK